MSEDRITQRTVTLVMGVIAALAFVFSFGNVWALALRLGIPDPIAPLIAPMVDLSVVGLLVALRYLSLRGVPAAQMRSATRLMHVSGLLTLALNIAEPIAARHYGRAAVDAVAPLLLLGWGAVGPQLLRAFHTVNAVDLTPAPVPPAAPDPAPPAETAPALVDEPNADPAPAVPSAPAPALVTEPTSAPVPVMAPTPAPAPAPAPVALAIKVPAPLLAEARSIADSHQTQHGAPITADQLRRRLGVGLPMANALHAALAS
ncbi:SpdA protein [Streptomyces albus subsp. albus]|nr:SpdA protein [Streptomyces albus subsp. albus]